MEIRRRVLVEGMSKRRILRETGMHWTTLEKILAHSRPPAYRRRVPCKRPKIGPYLGRIVQILEADKALPRKQRHTAKRIWRRLMEQGSEGGYTIVKDAVRELRQRRFAYSSVTFAKRSGWWTPDSGPQTICCPRMCTHQTRTMFMYSRSPATSPPGASLASGSATRVVQRSGAKVPDRTTARLSHTWITRTQPHHWKRHPQADRPHTAGSLHGRCSHRSS